MNKQELRELKARAQRLESLIDSFEDDVALLHENGVDVSSSTDIDERQKTIQDEIEQVVSDILLILDTSGTVSSEDVEIDLPNRGRRPVADGSLPEPRFDRPEGRGTPAWVKGNKNNDKGD